MHSSVIIKAILHSQKTPGCPQVYSPDWATQQTRGARFSRRMTVAGRCSAQGCAADGCAISATFSFSHFSTDGNTNLLTSPPNCAISRTIVPEMNWY